MNKRQTLLLGAAVVMAVVTWALHPWEESHTGTVRNPVGRFDYDPAVSLSAKGNGGTAHHSLFWNTRAAVASFRLSLRVAITSGGPLGSQGDISRFHSSSCSGTLRDTSNSIGFQDRERSQIAASSLHRRPAGWRVTSS